MNPVCEAIKYTINATGLSSRSLKGLVETSEGYSGEDYNRWMAAQLIHVAGNQGVDIIQLLTKWTPYIIEIENSSSESLPERVPSEFVEEISKRVNGSVAVLGDLDGIKIDGAVSYKGDWRQGVDLDEYNAFFTKDGGEDFEKVVSSGSFTLISTADDSKSYSKSSELKVHASAEGIKLGNEGQMLLYRALNMARSHMDTDIRIVCVSPASFWSSPVNKGLMALLLDNFVLVEESSFYTNSRNFDPENMREGLVTVCVFDTAGIDDPDTTRISLKGLNGEDELLFYSRNHLSLEGFDSFLAGTDSSLYLTKTGEISTKKKPCGTEGAYGYLSVSGSSKSLGNLPRVGFTNYAITDFNIDTMIAFWGLSEATQNNVEYGAGIPEMLTGLTGFDKVVANSLPLFLFGNRTNFMDRGVLTLMGDKERLRNGFANTSMLVEELTSKYLPFMDFEASSFYMHCKNLEETQNRSVASFLAAVPEAVERMRAGKGTDEDKKLVTAFSKFRDGYKEKQESLVRHNREKYSKYLAWV